MRSELEALLDEYSLELAATEGWKKDPQAAREAQLRDWIAAFGNENAEITLHDPVGCDVCAGTGYRGRVGVYELFAMDATLREMCFRGAGTVKLRDQAKISGGLVSLMDDGVKKFLAGDTTIEEVLTVAISGDTAAA